MHTSVVARRSALRIVVALILCVLLLLVQNVSFVINTVSAQGQNSKREGRPTPGKPEASLPDMEDVQNESHLERQPAPPIPSTIRSPKVPLQPWNGRRVGDPGTRGEFVCNLFRQVQLLSRVAKQGRFVYGDTIKEYPGFKAPGATNRGSISRGDAQVELPTPWSNFNLMNREDIAESARRITLFSVMHELIHLSGKKGYLDIQLANTVAAMTGLRPPAYAGKTSDQAVWAASISWNGAMEFACKPRKK